MLPYILKAINLDPTIQSSFSNKAQALMRLTTHNAAQAALELLLVSSCSILTPSRGMKENVSILLFSIDSMCIISSSELEYYSFGTSIVETVQRSSGCCVESHP
jgi:hypothetical protein